jgi:hypothetical protein
MYAMHTLVIQAFLILLNNNNNNTLARGAEKIFRPGPSPLLAGLSASVYTGLESRRVRCNKHVARLGR